MGLSILKRLAPEKAREGILFSVSPDRIEPAPWVESIPNGDGPLDDLVRMIWSFGLQAPLLGRRLQRDRYELIAEPEFLEAAEKAQLKTLRLHVVDVDDALGRAVAIATRLRSVDAEAVSPLRAALDDAGVSMPPDLLAEIALLNDDLPS